MPRVEYNSKEDKGYRVLAPQPGALLKIVEIEEGVSKAKQAPQLVVKFNVLGGVNEGANFSQFYSLLPQAAFKINQLCDACAVEVGMTETGDVDEKGEPLFACGFDTDDLLGQEFIGDITQREYEGKTQNNLDNPRMPADAPVAVAKAAPKAAPAPAAAPAQRQAAAVGPERQQRRTVAATR
jgi:hypothetical protein